MIQDILITLGSSALHALLICVAVYVGLSVMGILWLLVNRERLQPDFVKCCHEDPLFLLVYLGYFPIYLAKKLFK